MVDPVDPIVPLGPSGPHPEPEQLYRARPGPRTAEAERWLAHATTCAACAEELLRQEAFDAPEPVSSRRVAAAWERFGESEAAQRQEPARRAAGPRAGLALVAILAAVLLGLGVWTRLHPSAAEQGALRGAAEPAGAWFPAGVLSAAPAEIVFPVPAGETRRVLVFSFDRSYTWKSPPSRDGHVAFPAAERLRLRKGVDYYWSVVEDEDGTAARKFRLQ
jgi:hypothetical protein